jgi:hypothetical protein
MGNPSTCKKYAILNIPARGAKFELKRLIILGASALSQLVLIAAACYPISKLVLVIL